MSAASLNIIEAIESPGSTSSIETKQEGSGNIKEKTTVLKSGLLQLDKRLPNMKNINKKDSFMQRKIQSLKVIRGVIIYREITLNNSKVLQLVLPEVYKETALLG